MAGTVLSAIAEKDEDYVFNNWVRPQKFIREAGEALHPKRGSVATWNALRKKWARIFMAQYQRSPTLAEGLLAKAVAFKRYSPEDLPEDFDEIVQSWDTASKAGELNDYSVYATGARWRGDTIYLMFFGGSLNTQSWSGAYSIMQSFTKPPWF